MRSPVQIWVAAPKSRWNPSILAGFFYILQLFRLVYFCGFSLTHTVTHTAKCPERDRECQTGSSAFLPGFFAAFSSLHDPRHEVSHRLRRPILLLPGGVGVGAEGEARIVVSQHTGDRFHIYTVLEGQSRECVPVCYNKDKSGNPLKIKENRTCPYSFSNHIPGKIRLLRLRSERRCCVRNKAKFAKPGNYRHRKQNTAAAQRSSQLPYACAGEPTTYTMDSVHTAGSVYPFSGKYARKILRLDQSTCLF